MTDVIPMADEQALPKLRMDAYYYGFNETGVRCVDEILSAVASAGKGYHHTEEWGSAGYIDQIQAAAGRAAALMNAAPELLAALKAAQKDLETVQREMSGIAPEAVSPALPLIRAAIAKAEGRS